MLNLKSLLNVLPALLLSVVQVLGMSEVVRSQPVREDLSLFIAPQPANQNKRINQFIEQLKVDDPKVRSNAAFALGKIGEATQSTIPNLISLLKDSDWQVRSSATEALSKLGYKIK
jgi:HEAT repeat protein